MKYLTYTACILIVICTSCIAQNFTPQVTPLTDIYIPLGSNEVLARAYPTGRYPFITETPRSYLLLFNVGTNKTIGLIPKFDARRSPTAYVEDKVLVVRPGVNTSIYRGYVPYEAKRKYEVVTNTDSGFMAKYEYGDFSIVCELAKTSVVYISEADMHAEYEAVERDRLLRAQQYQREQEAKIAADRAYQQQIQEAAAERERIRQDRIQAEQDKAAQEERMRQAELKQKEDEMRNMPIESVAANPKGYYGCNFSFKGCSLTEKQPSEVKFSMPSLGIYNEGIGYYSCSVVSPDGTIYYSGTGLPHGDFSFFMHEDLFKRLTPYLNKLDQWRGKITIKGEIDYHPGNEAYYGMIKNIDVSDDSGNIIQSL